MCESGACPRTVQGIRVFGIGSCLVVDNGHFRCAASAIAALIEADRVGDFFFCDEFLKPFWVLIVMALEHRMNADEGYFFLLGLAGKYFFSQWFIRGIENLRQPGQHN